MSDAQPLESLHIFLTSNAGCGESFLMKVLYQPWTKLLLDVNVLLDKPKVLLLAPRGTTAANILMGQPYILPSKYLLINLKKKITTSKR